MGKKTFQTAIKLAVSAGLMAALYSKLDWSDIAAKLRGADARWLGLAFAIMFLNTAVSAAKWRIFLKADGLAQPISTLWASYITASFFNLFLPSTIGGDAYRVADIGSRTGQHSRVAASILADRITGFLALSLYGCGAAFFARKYVVEWQHWFPLPSFCALAALAALAVALCSKRLMAIGLRLVPGAAFRAKVAGITGKVVDAMRLYAGRPRVLAGAIAISFLFQFDLILAVWAITRAIGLGIPFATFFLFLPIKTFLEMVPVSVFGLGLRDLGYAIFMGAMGFGGEAAACAALISAAEVLLTVVYSSIGGVVFICRRGNGERGTGNGEQGTEDENVEM
jgi:uncharacterized protein (TIRG00374 family)